MHCNFSKTRVYSDQQQITKFNVPEIKALSFVQQIAVVQLIERKGAARGGAEGAQAPPLAIRILMFIS